jgi:hypothetical protein
MKRMIPTLTTHTHACTHTHTRARARPRTQSMDVAQPRHSIHYYRQVPGEAVGITQPLSRAFLHRLAVCVCGVLATRLMRIVRDFRMMPGNVLPSCESGLLVVNLQQIDSWQILRTTTVGAATTRPQRRERHELALPNAALRIWALAE